MSHEQYKDYVEKEQGIFNNFRSIMKEMGVTRGVERDPGIEPQSAFLVAWRYSDQVTSDIQEFSLEAAEIIGSLVYGPDNAHTTISDFKLQKDATIKPGLIKEDDEILDGLSTAVKRTLDMNDKEVISGCGVEFTDMLTNAKTIIAAGVPNESIWQINNQVLEQSHMQGIDLKGTWGAHMTTSRFTEALPADSPAVHDLMRLIKKTPNFGSTVPVAIDVGYFHTDPKNGFVFTPYERFDLPK